MFKSKSKSNGPPLDIPFGKLLDTVLEKGVLSAKWSDRLADIQRRAETTKATIPAEAPEEIRALLAKENAGYFECARVMELLVEWDGGDTTLVGNYKSQLLHDWYRGVSSAYERGNVYLGEAARFLSATHLYEVPALKQTASSNAKQLGDVERKIEELERSCAELERQRGAQLAELGIAGKNYRAELPLLANGIPALLTVVVEAAQADGVVAGLAYHAELVAFLHRGTAREAAAPALLPNLRRLVAEGAALVPEVSVAAVAAEDDDIDWGISSGGGDGGGGADIDWDLGIESAGGEEEVAAVEIEWDIGIESSGADAIEIEAVEIECEGAGSSLTLADAPFRSGLLNDAVELRAFLLQREAELSGDGGSAFMGQFQGESAVLQEQSAKQMRGYLGAVDGLLKALGSEDLHMRLSVQQNPRYLERMATALQQKDTHISKLSALRDKTKLKKDELAAAIQDTGAKLKQIADASKALRTKVEAKMSKLMGGRKVVITGTGP